MGKFLNHDHLTNLLLKKNNVSGDASQFESNISGGKVKGSRRNLNDTHAPDPTENDS